MVGAVRSRRELWCRAGCTSSLSLSRVHKPTVVQAKLPAPRFGEKSRRGRQSATDHHSTLLTGSRWACVWATEDSAGASHGECRCDGWHARSSPIPAPDVGSGRCSSNVCGAVLSGPTHFPACPRLENCDREPVSAFGRLCLGIRRARWKLCRASSAVPDCATLSITVFS